MDIRRALGALALVLAVAGCGPGEPVELAVSESGQGCFLASTTGRLIADPDAGTAIIQEDMGQATVPVAWPAGYTGRRSGSEVEVLDGDGRVVARTGERLMLLGGYGDLAGGGAAWIACADGVLPAP